MTRAILEEVSTLAAIAAFTFVLLLVVGAI
jgi:hypothetical protein